MTEGGINFDTRPPMPVSEYETTVRQVNVGYDLGFMLTHCLLRSLGRKDLNLLVVGAGGGAEIERFLPQDAGWRLTGVDPSADMLALARSKAEGLGVTDRVDLLQGRVEDLPEEPRFDAAVCIFVLHFLSDPEKISLLRAVKQRLVSGGPALLVTAGARDDDGLTDDFLGAWQRYGEYMGLPAERMASTIQHLSSMPRTAASEYERMIREAGFAQVASFLSVLGSVTGWIAR